MPNEDFKLNQPLRLSVGSHVPGSYFGCAMNVLTWEQQQPISDWPVNVDPVLAKTVQLLNDNLCTHYSDKHRTLCAVCTITVLKYAHSVADTRGQFGKTTYKKQAALCKTLLLESAGADAVSVSPVTREIYATAKAFSVPLPHLFGGSAYLHHSKRFHKWARRHTNRGINVYYPARQHKAKISAIFELYGSLFEFQGLTPPLTLPAPAEADFALWEKQLVN